jgi:DNA invertase Pin-like site-specific DNA recombinase
MPKAYSYLRFSTPEQAQGDSLRRQGELAVQYAASHGLDLDERSYRDLGMSAYRGANAETGMLGEFLDMVKAGNIERGSFLLVESLDRISRNKPRKAVRLLERICEEGITVVTLNDGKVYSEETLDDDPMAFMWAFMIAIRANEESATKSRRVRAAWDQKRRKAKETPLTRIAPGWLRLEGDRFVVIKERARVVKRIFEWTLKGEGQHAIAQRLNGDKVPVFGEGKREGKHWHRTYIKKMLTNPAVIGVMIPHRMDYVDGRKVRVPQEPVMDYYPAVISKATYDNVQAMRLDTLDPRRGANAAKPLQNILGGLAKCPLCGSTMTRTDKGHRTAPYLVCTRAKAGSGCDYRTVKCRDVEEAIVRLGTHSLLRDMPAGDSALDDALHSLERDIERAEAELENYLDALGSGSTAIADRLGETERKLAKLKTEHANAARKATASAGPLVRKRASDLVEVLKHEPLDRQHANALLRQLLSSVIVDYVNHELRLQWKHDGTTVWPFVTGEIFADQKARKAL